MLRVKKRYINFIVTRFLNNSMGSRLFAAIYTKGMKYDKLWQSVVRSS
jgi:hypothetical protein